MADQGKKEIPEFLKKTRLYQEFEAEQKEILKHKWLESEKAGHDIGFDRAFFDWELRYYSKWRAARTKPAESTLHV
jgi:hypothetical protein